MKSSRRKYPKIVCFYNLLLDKKPIFFDEAPYTKRRRRKKSLIASSENDCAINFDEELESNDHQIDSSNFDGKKDSNIQNSKDFQQCSSNTVQKQINNQVKISDILKNEKSLSSNNDIDESQKFSCNILFDESYISFDDICFGFF